MGFFILKKKSAVFLKFVQSIVLFKVDQVVPNRCGNPVIMSFVIVQDADPLAYMQ